MAQTFRIVLSDDKGFDAHGSREFDLLLNSTFPIGRASKNTTKPTLLPAPDNAYIDSPVVSRDHALLSAHARSGVPQVYISDRGSMHGTLVNGVKLAPNTPEPLSPGDLLQFGADVNRNESSFVARKYTFRSRLVQPQHMFSHGFTVPEGESEADDVVHLPRRGSQENPLTVDDSDSASESDEAQDTSAEVTMFDQDVVLQSEGSIAASETRLNLVTIPSPSVGFLVTEDSYSGEESLLIYTEDENSDVFEDDLHSCGEDAMSDEAASVADSSLSGSGLPTSDVEAGGTLDAAHHRTTPAHKSSEMMQVPPGQSPETSSSNFQTRNFFWNGASPEDMASNQAPELPSFGAFIDQTTFVDSIAPPLPPRPSRQSVPWGRMEFTSSMQENVHHERHSEDLPGASYLGTNFGDRPSLFSPAPLASCQTPQGFLHGHEGAEDFHVAPAASRIQTPPPMPVSDMTLSISLPPNRRTKVSITEIVEEVDGQPPTPTSVNDLKRKADVLEEELSISIEHSAEKEVKVAADSDEVAVERAAEVAAVVAQRPKKQPRSIISKTLRTAAAYIVPGAAVSFALLATLPQSVFEF